MRSNIKHLQKTPQAKAMRYYVIHILRFFSQGLVLRTIESNELVEIVEIGVVCPKSGKLSTSTTIDHGEPRNTNNEIVTTSSSSDHLIHLLIL